MSRNLRIGIFTAIGVAFIIGFSVYVNDHPYWYRPCNEVKIHVDDATGLRRKSPVKTLGLDIGFINAVSLDGDNVMVRVCVTGPVKLNAETRAYIRSSGFLGDKFLELKPVDMNNGEGGASSTPAPETVPVPKEKSNEGAPGSESSAIDIIKMPSAAPIKQHKLPGDEVRFEKMEDSSEESIPDPDQVNAGPYIIQQAISLLLSPWTQTAHAEAAEAAPQQTLNASREAELQDTVKKVGKLIDQLTLMVGDLREVTQQKDFKETVVNLNAAMKHLEGLLRPTGKTMKNLDATMESLKNTAASAEVVLKKVENGEGTIGKFVNDPSIFEELKAAIKSLNMLLGKAGTLKTYVDIGGSRIDAYDGNKARFSVIIAPNPGRYYLVGITSDPRGRDRTTRTTTRINNGSPSVEEKTVNEEKGLRITALFGKYFGPFDLKIGIIEDNGAAGAGIWFDSERRFGIHAEVYSAGKNQPISLRAYARAQIISSIYLTGGIDDNHKYYGKTPYFMGAGLFFDDDDLKYLLAFK